jgi:5-methylcytosine-specific restriction endonuclease McrA
MTTEQAQRQRKDRKNATDKRYRDKARDELFTILGRVCKRCGATAALQFDVIIPVGGPKDHHGKMSSTSRMGFYRRQHHERHNLQVLCSSCNTRKKDSVDMFLHKAPEPQSGPF